LSKHLFIAGAQRSGTTYLYRILDGHPQIEMNKPWWPEPKFFLEPGSELRVAEYVSKYFPATTAAILGDKSASYIESVEAASRISKCFPDAQILFILRDPINRAISNYWYTVQNNLEDKPIDEVLVSEALQQRQYDHQSISVSPYSYLKRGRYIDYLNLYLQHFKVDQIKVLVFENFVGNAVLIKELYRFLRVDHDFVPPTLDEKVNEGPVGASIVIRPETEKFLADYYAHSNKLLAERFDIDVGVWQN